MIDIITAKVKPSDRGGATSAASVTVATVATIAANPLQKLRMAADVSPVRR